MIHSVAGMLDGGRLVKRPPFREPHHGASQAALAGGGSRARPGEVSLAHRGVLFLDELPEFPRPVLETLRQPMESGHTTVARAAAHVTYPARFQLIAAMNPCRCGHLGDAHARMRPGATLRRGLPRQDQRPATRPYRSYGVRPARFRAATCREPRQASRAPSSPSASRSPAMLNGLEAESSAHSSTPKQTATASHSQRKPAHLPSRPWQSCISHRAASLALYACRAPLPIWQALKRCGARTSRKH